MDRLAAALKEVRHHLAHLTDYAVGYLSGLAKRLAPAWERKTELSGFNLVDVKEAAKRDLPLRYDGQSGYLGTSVSTGEARFEVSTFDKVLVIRRNGIWSVVPAPERLFVDQGLLYCALADKEALSDLVFSLVYRDGATGFPYLKRFKIEGWIMSKDYPLIPENSQTLWFSSAPQASFTVKFEKKARQRVSDESFRVEDFAVKGIKANGVRLAPKACAEVEGEESPGSGGAELFGAGRAARAVAPKRAPAATKPAPKGGLLAAAEARKASASKPKSRASGASSGAKKAVKGAAKAAKSSASKGKKKRGD
jgi:topoisomerase-4 subunit A